jgi:hypothetical protein
MPVQGSCIFDQGWTGKITIEGMVDDLLNLGYISCDKSFFYMVKSKMIKKRKGSLAPLMLMLEYPFLCIGNGKALPFCIVKFDPVLVQGLKVRRKFVRQL